MSLLLLPKQYKDGNVLYKTALDAIVTALLNFFNAQKLGGDNVQTGGITQAKLDFTTASLFPIGAIVEWPLSVAPPGGNWALANGAAVSRTTYSTLFGLAGISFGPGNGTTTFNLPDKRGRLGAGRGTSAALTIIDPSTLGASGGNQLLEQHTHGAGTATIGQSGSGHTHGISEVSHKHTLRNFPTQDSGTGALLNNVPLRRNNSPTSISVTPGAGNTFAGVTAVAAITGTTTDTETGHTHILGGTTSATGTGGHGSIQPVLVNTYIVRLN